MKLSVIVPVYNERRTILTILDRIRQVPFDKEIIIVDDGSCDGTSELLRSVATEPSVTVVHHEHNRGKGAALRTGLACARGDVVIIQDADLEYWPEDYPVLVDLIQRGAADVVFGSRFLGRHRVFLFTHRIGNAVVNLIANVLFNTTLTDLETGLKVFRREITKDFQLRSNDFRIEAELTAKICKRKYRLYEVPILYTGRSYDEGKKITWRDGMLALWALFRFRLAD